MDPLGEKRKRSAEENVELLKDQLRSLSRKCREFDRGDTTQPMKEAASILRNLVHHAADLGKKGNTSLLEAMGIRGGPWLDASMSSALPDAQFPLVIYNGSNGVVIPAFCERNQVDVPFEQWWTGDVAFSEKYGNYSRRGIVRSVADFDGSHIDQELPEKYLGLYDGTFLPWTVTQIGSEKTIGGLAQAAIRQIAHEVLATLRAKCREAYPDEYAFWWNGYGPQKFVDSADASPRGPIDPTKAPAFVIKGMSLAKAPEDPNAPPGPHLSIKSGTGPKP